MTPEEGRLALRPAGLADGALLREWRNEPATRAASRSSHEVSEAEHRAWLDRVLADPDRMLWVAERNGEPIGQVRFDRIAAGSYEISVSVDSALRGQGLGGRLICAACRELWRTSPGLGIVAWVRSSNAVSAAAFVAAGFHATGERDGEFEKLAIDGAATAVGPDD